MLVTFTAKEFSGHVPDHLMPHKIEKRRNARKQCKKVRPLFIASRAGVIKVNDTCEEREVFQSHT